MTVPFNDSEVSTMRNYFLANINIQSKGGIGNLNLFSFFFS
jgi:hypothetical protein